VNAVAAARLIDARGEPLADRWRLLRADDFHDLSQPTLLPLPALLAAPPSPLLGPWLAPTDDPAALAGRIERLPMVAIDFPKFADGRGYSLATLLRRLGYRGELRAVGEVLIDQLSMLGRVGFTSFALRADQSLAAARAALARYSDASQGTADRPLPAYRRHRRATAGVVMEGA
jgi:uncharacterized protein (DUF934 family)